MKLARPFQLLGELILVEVRLRGPRSQSVRNLVLPRHDRPGPISPDQPGHRVPLTRRDDGKATRLLVIRDRLGEVRVPPLALLSQADSLTSFLSSAAAAT